MPPTAPTLTQLWGRPLTGSGHRWTGIGAAFFAAAIARLAGLPEVVAGGVALFSCTVPDWIEIPYYRGGMRVGSLITHRTITHWPPLWLLLMAWGCNEGTFIGAIAVGVSMGSMTHIFGDAPNPMGIPWLWPTKRLRIGKKGLWRSGQREFLIITGYGFAGYLAWRLTGGQIPWGVAH